MTTAKDTKASKPAPEELAAEATPEPADYFAVARTLTAGEKLQLLTKLNVEEIALARFGTAQLVAVAWKYRKTNTGNPKVTDLLNMTDEQLLGVLDMTEDDLTAQIEAERGDSKSDDD